MNILKKWNDVYTIAVTKSQLCTYCSSPGKYMCKKLITWQADVNVKTKSSEKFQNIHFIFIFISAKMRTIYALLALVAVAQAVSFADVIKEEWHTFKVSNARGGQFKALSTREIAEARIQRGKKKAGWHFRSHLFYRLHD